MFLKITMNNMEKIIKKAIKESWNDYQDASIGMDENEQRAYDHG